MSTVALSPDLVGFWTERHLCTVSTTRPDGSMHVVPMGVALDPEAVAAWAITSGRSQKVRNIEAAGAAGALVAVCQVDGRRWSTIEGRVRVLRDPASVAHAEQRYAGRYRPPRENLERVALHIQITRLLANLR
jgi:PPOX class probable F420-dependent enzyme